MTDLTELNLAAAGIHVFPCKNQPRGEDDKRPLTNHGFHDATTDAAQDSDMVAALAGCIDRRADRGAIRRGRSRPSVR